MFDIRKNQENVIYEAVKAESNTDIANEVVYGKERLASNESNPNWGVNVLPGTAKFFLKKHLLVMLMWSY